MNTALLDLLADGEFHSGAALAERLKVSRTTIWNQIQSLQALGVELHSVRGRGYRIAGGLDLLDKTELCEQLKSLGVLDRFDLIDLTLTSESTNLCAQRAIATGYRRSLFVTEYQSAGKGRRGRSWASPLGANLYFSLSWPFSGGVVSLEGLSLAVGLAVRRALEALHIDGVQLKWPNDLLLEAAKLGGILIEVGGDLSGECTAVIGVGLNVRMPDAAQSAIDQPWADLSERIPDSLKRTNLLAVLLTHLVQMLDRFSETGFGPLRDEWQMANAYHDAKVNLIVGDQQISGICRGVDRSGALLLETPEGERTFQGGEVSLRAG